MYLQFAQVILMVFPHFLARSEELRLRGFRGQFPVIVESVVIKQFIFIFRKKVVDLDLLRVNHPFLFGAGKLIVRLLSGARIDLGGNKSLRGLSELIERKAFVIQLQKNRCQSNLGVLLQIARNFLILLTEYFLLARQFGTDNIPVKGGEAFRNARIPAVKNRLILHTGEHEKAQAQLTPRLLLLIYIKISESAIRDKRGHQYFTVIRIPVDHVLIKEIQGLGIGAAADFLYEHRDLRAVCRQQFPVRLSWDHPIGRFQDRFGLNLAVLVHVLEAPG